MGMRVAGGCVGIRGQEAVWESGGRGQCGYQGSGSVWVSGEGAGQCGHQGSGVSVGGSGGWVVVLRLTSTKLALM